MDTSIELVFNEEALYKKSLYLDNKCPIEEWERLLNKSTWSSKSFMFFTQEQIEEQEREARPPKPDVVSEYMSMIRAKQAQERKDRSQ
jgi:hypothetical protein